MNFLAEVPKEIQDRIAGYHEDKSAPVFKAGRALVTNYRMRCAWTQVKAFGANKVLIEDQQSKEDFANNACRVFFDAAICAAHIAFGSNSEWERMTAIERERWRAELTQIERRLRTHLSSGPMPVSAKIEAAALLANPYETSIPAPPIADGVATWADLWAQIFSRLRASHNQKLKKPRDAKAVRKRFVLELWDQVNRRMDASGIAIAVYTSTTQSVFDDDGVTESWIRRTLKDRV